MMMGVMLRLRQNFERVGTRNASELDRYYRW
jgi:hypothetical protein